MKSALRIAQIDESPSFGELLNKDNPVPVHHRNIRALATRKYKVMLGLSPPF